MRLIIISLTVIVFSFVASAEEKQTKEIKTQTITKEQTQTTVKQEEPLPKDTKRTIPQASPTEVFAPQELNLPNVQEVDYMVEQESENVKNTEITKLNTQNPQPISNKAKNNQEEKPVLGYYSKLGLTLGYIRAAIERNHKLSKFHNVALRLDGTRFLNNHEAIEFDTMKLSGKRYNERLLAPSYTELKYTSYRNVAGYLIKGGIGLNYFDNGVRGGHDAIQRHIVSFFAHVGNIIRMQKGKYADINFSISPRLNYVFERPSDTNYSAEATMLKLSGKMHLPTHFDPSSKFTFGADVISYVYNYTRQSIDRQSDYLIFLGAGFIKEF